MNRSSHLLRVVRYAWAAPCSLVGLALAGAFLLCGGRARMRSGVLEVALRRRARQTRFPFGAITFGHVVLGLDEMVLDRLRAHEFVHVGQYERWGLVFFLAYPASSLWQWLRGRNPYWDNHFEIEARDAAKQEESQRKAGL